MACTYKLTYFDIKGLGEPIRYLLKYAGISFEDDRFSFEQWPSVKPSTPFGQVPILTINGKVYNQTVALARFVAKKAKLVGKDDFENMEIDSIIDTINDIRTKIALNHYNPDEESKKKNTEVLKKETIPYYLDRLEEIVKKNNGHCACNKLTWADLFFVSMMDLMEYYSGEKLFAKYPCMTKLRETVNNLPAIKAWIKERPESAF